MKGKEKLGVNFIPNDQYVCFLFNKMEKELLIA